MDSQGSVATRPGPPPGAFAPQGFERRCSGVHERRAQHQIFRRVPHQHELRYNHQVCVAGGGLIARTLDERHVSADITDGGIYLGECDR